MCFDVRFAENVQPTLFRCAIYVSMTSFTVLFEWKTVEVTSEELDGVLTDEICSNALTDLLGGE